MGRIARTAACFCVFLTLETSTFFVEALRAAGLAVALAVALVATFFDLVADFPFAAVFFAAVFFAARTGAAFRGGDFAARRALGFEADLALTTRFALFAAGFALERDVDRIKPFVRLLLMCGNLKGCSGLLSRRGIAGSLTQARL